MELEIIKGKICIYIFLCHTAPSNPRRLLAWAGRKRRRREREAWSDEAPDIYNKTKISRCQVPAEME